MANACCGRWAVDDDDGIARLLDGLELPDVADNGLNDALGPPWDETDELGDY